MKSFPAILLRVAETVEAIGFVFDFRQPQLSLRADLPDLPNQLAEGLPDKAKKIHAEALPTDTDFFCRR